MTSDECIAKAEELLNQIQVINLDDYARLSFAHLFTDLGIAKTLLHISKILYDIEEDLDVIRHKD